jgi:carbamoyl-phosphate synthase/aspartate carbamoyltransferase/dihydroorotase
LSEKDGSNPPPGFPGLETALPLFLTAVGNGKLTLDEVIARMYTNPKRIFNLPDQPDTYIEIDENQPWVIQSRNTYTRCAWTPFEGREVQGQLKQVVLRGKAVYKEGRVFAPPGYGQSIRTIG